MLGAKDTPSLELGFAVALPSKTLEIAREKEWSDRIGGASLISQASCRICNLPLVLLAQLATFVGSSDRLLEIMVCSSFLPSNAQRTSCSSESQGYPSFFLDLLMELHWFTWKCIRWLIRRTKRSSVPLPIVNVNLPTAKPKPIAKPATPSMPATPTWGSSASSFSQNFSLGGSSSVKPSFNDLLKKRNAAYNKSLPIAPPIASRSPAELKSQEDKEDSFSTSLQKLTLSNTTKCRLALKTWSVEFYPSTRQHKKKDKKKTPTEEEGTSTPGLDSEWKEESYEKMSIPGVTKFFKTFQKEVQEEPEQSIR